VKDMREIDFDAQFDAIICMNSAFLYLLTDDDILKTLKAFQRALNNGGLVIIDIMNFLSLIGRYREEVVGRQIKDGVVCETAIKHSIEDVPAIWNHDEFGIINDNGREITYHEQHRLRMVNYNEMKRFLSDAGFRDIKCFSEFTDREEAKTNARRLILVGVR
jgi:ubiquinone/menaquinone biosynthesis C-methylase UbiE